MHTVYRRLPDDEIMWRGKTARYVGYGILTFTVILFVSFVGISIVYLDRAARIALACFIVGGIMGIAIGRSSR